MHLYQASAVALPLHLHPDLRFRLSERNLGVPLSVGRGFSAIPTPSSAPLILGAAVILSPESPRRPRRQQMRVTSSFAAHLVLAQTVPSPAYTRGEPTGSRDLARSQCLGGIPGPGGQQLGLVWPGCFPEREHRNLSLGPSVLPLPFIRVGLHVPERFCRWGSGRTVCFFRHSHCSCASLSNEGFVYVLCLCSSLEAG